MRQAQHYTEEQLLKFWECAAQKVPIIIIGGGRWARVWAEVIAKAHGDSKNITIVSRNHSSDVKAWANSKIEFKDVKIHSSLLEVDFSTKDSAVALVVGRPRHHCRDAIDAMKLGLDVLLEKPLAHNLRDAKSIVTFSQLKQRSLAVVNEFSFLPAFNFVSELISNNQNQLKSIKIDWFDVPNEVRHGLIKRHHEEVSYIQDIVPHCISILGVFVSGLEIEGKKMPSSLNRGVLSFSDDKSRLHTFSYNNNCDARKRVVAVETNTALITIDFSEKKSRLLVQGKYLDTPKRTEFLDSTLRLQLGAFLFNRGYKNLQNLESVYFHMVALDKFI